jgi:hypothetical protein
LRKSKASALWRAARAPSCKASAILGRRRLHLLPLGALVAAFVVLLVPVLVAQRGGTAGAKDQEYFHLPTIRTYADDLPAVDIDDHGAAMGPAYHLVMAVAQRVVGRERAALQAVAALFTLALLAAAYLLAVRWVDPWLAVALVAPLACSHYVLQAAGWLNTDNLALLFVVLALGAALGAVRTGRGLVAAGASATAAVLVRQVHLWLAGVILVAGVLAPDAGSRRRPLVRAAAAALLPVAGLLLLVAAWGGVNPPDFRGSAAFRPAAVPFMLALAGLFGTPYLLATGWWSPRALLGRGSLTAAALGALTALVPFTAASEDDGHTGGGLWQAIDRAPTVADRSLLLAALAAWGAAVLLAWWRVHRGGPREREATLLFVALGGFTAAHVAVFDVYQRYLEPLVLVVLLLLGAITLASRAGEPQVRRRAFAALAVLTAIQLAGIASEVYRAMGDAPPIERAYPDAPQNGL